MKYDNETYTLYDEPRNYTDRESGVSLNSSITGVRIRERGREFVMKYETLTYCEMNREFTKTGRLV